jgi:uncharacterized repeat protein (TIGR01451 family)
MTQVLSPAANSATKTVSGTPIPGAPITYTIVVTNSGVAPQQDNPGDELTDVLPPDVLLVSANATSGTAIATIATNTVTWNGSIPAGGSVTIVINAAVSPSAAHGQVVSNQATVASDTNGDGTNDANAPSQNVPGGGPTTFTVMVPGVIVSPTNVAVIERGATATFAVSLNSPPASNVVISIGNPLPAEISIDRASLTFTSTDWNTPQSVVVAAVDDQADDGDQNVTLALTAATADANYAAIDPADVSVNSIDSDIAGFTIAAPPLTLSEAAGTATFTVVLTSKPAANVVIPVSSSNTAIGTVAPASLTFTATDWNVVQTVTATGVDNATLGPNPAWSVVLGPAVSGDGLYQGLDPADVPVTTLDDDVDTDGDGISDAADNCPSVANAGQTDLDGDGQGDTCDPDSDGDGVADLDEDAGPNGGDANVDGIADSDQPTVASLAVAEGSGQVTVVANCGLRDVATRTSASVGVADSGWIYPAGAVEFQLPCASATVDLYYSAFGAWPGGTAYRKYGPTTPGSPGTAAWYTLPTATFDSAMLGSSSVAHVRLMLTDGSLGDDTAVDGVIVDQGGPAIPATAIPLASPSMLLALALALAAYGAIMLRRM